MNFKLVKLSSSSKIEILEVDRKFVKGLTKSDKAILLNKLFMKENHKEQNDYELLYCLSTYH